MHCSTNKIRIRKRDWRGDFIFLSHSHLNIYMHVFEIIRNDKKQKTSPEKNVILFVKAQSNCLMQTHKSSLEEDKNGKKNPHFPFIPHSTIKMIIKIIVT